MSTPLFHSSFIAPTRGLLGRAVAGAVGGLLALALFAAPVSAQATISTDPGSTNSVTDRSTWQKHYGEQVKTLLRSDIEQKRGLALQTLLTLSSRPLAADLSPAVPALFELYESDATLEHRIMAATALRQVADRSTVGDQIMQRLGGLVADQSSERVQQLTLLVLADYETERGRALRLSPDLYDLVTKWGRA